MWITDELPEENRILLVYDMMCGLSIGYYDAEYQQFRSINDELLSNVSAWMYVPDKPNSIKRVIDTVRNHNFVETHKKNEGGTEDVQAQ